MMWQSPLIPPGAGGETYSLPFSPPTRGTAEMTLGEDEEEGEGEGGREGEEEVTYFDLLPAEVEGEECDPAVQQRVIDYMAQFATAAVEEEEEEGVGGKRRKRRRREGGRGGFTANL